MTIDASSPPALARFVRDQRRGVVATVSAAGHPEAALVGLTALDDGTLIFDSHQSFRKVANLQAASTVAVVVGLDGQVSVQVEGTARIAVAPDERRALAGAYLDQFPGAQVMHEEFVVIAVRPKWVRVYDASSDPATVVEARWAEEERAD